ncbi:hypothetical protein QIS74_06560 [Colletotrichum tabaci]|uniref:Uncharacterized protein n=1 Tax=Colletotrichum tabaci TaxID=1209068 RepID=A0AAV9TD97_9PEZI
MRFTLILLAATLAAASPLRVHSDADAATAYTADKGVLEPAEPVYRRSDADAATAYTADKHSSADAATNITSYLVRA